MAINKIPVIAPKVSMPTSIHLPARPATNNWWNSSLIAYKPLARTLKSIFFLSVTLFPILLCRHNIHSIPKIIYSVKWAVFRTKKSIPSITFPALLLPSLWTPEPGYSRPFFPPHCYPLLSSADLLAGCAEKRKMTTIQISSIPKNR